MRCRPRLPERSCVNAAPARIGKHHRAKVVPLADLGHGLVQVGLAALVPMYNSLVISPALERPCGKVRQSLPGADCEDAKSHIRQGRRSSPPARRGLVCFLNIFRAAINSSPSSDRTSVRASAATFMSSACSRMTWKPARTTVCTLVSSSSSPVAYCGGSVSPGPRQQLPDRRFAEIAGGNRDGSGRSAARRARTGRRRTRA